MIRAALAVSVVLIAALFAAPVSPLFAQGGFSGSKEVRCGKPGVSLQEAIDSAPSGFTIFITGTCNGPFFIPNQGHWLNKDLWLIGFGPGGATLSAPNGSGHVLLIGAGARVRMQDIRINAQGVGTGTDLGGASTLVAERITIENSQGAAINVIENSTLKLSDSSLRNNQQGLVILSSHASIFRSSISDNTFLGVVLRGGSTADIINTQINNNLHTGLIIEILSVATITDSTTIRGNRFSGVRVEFANSGLWFQGSPSTIEGNDPVDVSCVASGFITLWGGPQISNTKLTGIDPGCMVGSLPIFAP